MKLVERVRGWFTKSAEGSFRGPAVGFTHWGTPFNISFGDGFQDGVSISPRSAQNVPAVYAAVMATAKAAASCPARHIVTDATGRSKPSTTSPASRVLRKPNSYETWPQFILNAICAMLFYGECFVLLTRDDRNAVIEMHWFPPYTCMPYIEPETGAIFYSIGSNPMLPNSTHYMAPARDIMHLRQYTPRHPLIGESPITAAMLAVGVNVALSGNQAAFYNNMNRPSGILSTDQVLTRDQMTQLRQAFDEQAKGMNAGKIPVLSAGLKFSAMGITSQDAQVIEAQRMSTEDIARVFGVPLPMIGDLTKATMTNVEAMINFWLATALGSFFETIERSLDAAFNLPANEQIEFDEKALLRMDLLSRMDALAKGIQGGILAPNEARAIESLPNVEGGDQVFLQQQMIPVDMLTDMHQAEIDAKNRPPPATAAPAPAEPDPEDDPEDDPAEKGFDGEVTRALVIEMFQRKAA